ncbi:MAG: DUF2206 domain-containing protein [Actinobacteria bacterium]|nr:DUF2206 domain-containing protein [Actinomycetota bacterium]
MKLTRNRIFFGILIFGLAVNLLTFFNIDQFYFRAAITFIFLITIPGLLLMLIFKIQKTNPWEYLVYMIGLSVAFLIFGGLFVNWVLPFFGIDKPLSLIPLLISFDIFLLIFWFIGYKRNKNVFLEIQTPKLSNLDMTFLIISLFFPALSIFGALTLNNGGPNYLTMIMLSGIAVYVFAVVLCRNKINANVYPFSILMISIALLLAVSLRSWYVSGWDIYQEYYVFQLAKENFRWNMANFNDAYNACLSVTILPTVLSSFLKINDHYVFKLLFQLIFGFISVGVFIFLKRFALEIWAFIASFFFVSQSAFFVNLTKVVRQEIALLFFTLALIVLFSKSVDSIPKKIIFVVFGFSMIVSHYTTAYISIAFFLFTYLASLIFRKIENRKIFLKKDGKPSLKKEDTRLKERKYYLNGALVLVLIIFAVLWYAQLTKISSGLLDFTYKAIQNIGKITGTELREDGLSVGSQWNIFYEQEDKGPLLQDYVKKVSVEYKNRSYISLYLPERYGNYSPKITELGNLPSRVSPVIGSKIYPFVEIIKKIMKIFIIISTVYIFFFQLKKRRIDIEYIFLCFIGLFGIVAMMILPALTVEYSLERLYQQTLIFLSLLAVLGGFLIFKFIKENIRISLMVIIFLFYYLFFSGIIPQIAGGTDASLQLNNYGVSYDGHYAHKTEVLSSNWLMNNWDKKSLIYADKHASWRLLAFGKFITVNDDVLPSTIDRNSYVYLRYSNVVKNLNYKKYEGQTLSFNFPIEFLDQNKNLIYNNGGSKIFK